MNIHEIHSTITHSKNLIVNPLDIDSSIYGYSNSRKIKFNSHSIMLPYICMYISHMSTLNLFPFTIKLIRRKENSNPTP